MKASHSERMTKRYLKQLDLALSPLPRPRRRLLVAEIAEHLAQARAELADPSVAEVAKMLNRIGRPEDIAREAVETEIEPTSGAGTRQEVWTVVLLLVGGLVLPVVGWVAGVRSLWNSIAWTLLDKLIGTFVLPGGLLPAVLYVVIPAFAGTPIRPCAPLGGVGSTSGDGGTTLPRLSQCQFGTHTFLPVAGAGGDVLVAVLFLLPVLTAIYLNLRFRRPRLPAWPAAGSVTRRPGESGADVPGHEQAGYSSGQFRDGT